MSYTIAWNATAESMDFAEKVELGADWLDATVPGWEARVDEERLTMTDGCMCVLGQVFAESAKAAGAESGFCWANNEYAGTDWWHNAGLDWSCGLGFMTYQETRVSFEALQDAWLDLLADRRIAKRVAEVAQRVN